LEVLFILCFKYNPNHVTIVKHFTVNRFTSDIALTLLDGQHMLPYEDSQSPGLCRTQPNLEESPEKAGRLKRKWKSWQQVLKTF